MAKQDKEKLIIFDFDGVIADSLGLMAGAKEAIYKDFSWQSLQADMHASSTEAAIEQYRNAYTKKVDDTTAKKVWDDYAAKKKRCNLYPHIVDLLTSLHTSYTLALNTNARAATCKVILQENQIDQMFSLIYTADESTSKTTKNIQILNELSVSPENTVFITDTTSDVYDAKATGIQSIAVLWGLHEKSHFEEIHSDWLFRIVATVPELEQAIKQFFVEL